MPLRDITATSSSRRDIAAMRFGLELLRGWYVREAIEALRWRVPPDMTVRLFRARAAILLRARLRQEAGDFGPEALRCRACGADVETQRRPCSWLPDNPDQHRWEMARVRYRPLWEQAVTHA